MNQVLGYKHSHLLGADLPSVLVQCIACDVPSAVWRMHVLVAGRRSGRDVQATRNPVPCGKLPAPLFTAAPESDQQLQLAA